MNEWTHTWEWAGLLRTRLLWAHILTENVRLSGLAHKKKVLIVFFFRQEKRYPRAPIYEIKFAHSFRDVRSSWNHAAKSFVFLISQSHRPWWAPWLVIESTRRMLGASSLAFLIKRVDTIHICLKAFMMLLAWVHHMAGW